MFDKVYDFFYGDQIRKHVVLIGGFFSGQLLAIPLFERLEPSQYVPLAVMMSFISMWPLAWCYGKSRAVSAERVPEAQQTETRSTNQHDEALFLSCLGQIDNTLREMASRTDGGLAFNQTIREIITYFMDHGILSKKFLEDYEKLREDYRQGSLPIDIYIDMRNPQRGFASDNDPSLMRNTNDLLTRLHSISYANEKIIHELSVNFEMAMIRNLEILRGSGVSAEVIGSMMLKTNEYIRLIRETSNREVEQIIAEHKKTNP
jgi:hypothetical protein